MSNNGVSPYLVSRDGETRVPNSEIPGPLLLEVIVVWPFLDETEHHEEIERLGTGAQRVSSIHDNTLSAAELKAKTVLAVSMKVLQFLIGIGASTAFLLPQFPVQRLGVSTRSSSEEVTMGAPTVQYRPALAEEIGDIRRILAGMLMNPLSINAENFICAEDAGALVGFGQIRPIGGSGYELASLHVAESHRNQGIGSSLVRQLVSDFEATHGSAELPNLYLLTLKDTASFYKKLGFEVASDGLPATLKAERAVGSFLQQFFGNSLVCMRGVS